MAVEKYLDAAFEKLDECMTLLEKNMDKIFRKKIQPGTKIKIKKGSTVYLGKDVYATLTDDTMAVIKEIR